MPDEHPKGGKYNYTRPRGKIMAMFTGPGPIYGLPTLLGIENHDPQSVFTRYPAFTIASKNPLKTTSVGPGPAYAIEAGMYNNGKEYKPHWVLGLAGHGLKPFITPSPLAYYTECVKIHLFRPPSYTIGRKTGLKEIHLGPGPAAYTLDPLFGPRTIQAGFPQAPSYPLSCKLTIGSFLSVLAKTPGPAAYAAVPSDVFLNRPPEYTIRVKLNALKDRNPRPGPGAHDNHEVWVNKPREPKFTMRFKHSPFVMPVITKEDVSLDC